MQIIFEIVRNKEKKENKMLREGERKDDVGERVMIMGVG